MPAGEPPSESRLTTRKGLLMAFSLKRLGFVGVAGLSLLMGALAMTGGQALADSKKPAKPAAQPAQPADQANPSPVTVAPPGPVHVDLIPTQNDWTKVCGHDQTANKDICYTTRDFSAQADKPPVLAVAIYEIK